MKNIIKLVVVAATTMFLGAAQANADHREHVVNGVDGMHYLALQVSDNNPGTMTKVMNNALNITKSYQAEGMEIEIRIVAYNAGLHLLRSDTSPVLERLNSFNQSMPNVTFIACGNTIKGMTKNEGTPPPIVEHAVVVPGGIRELIDLDQAGWAVIRP